MNNRRNRLIKQPTINFKTKNHHLIKVLLNFTSQLAICKDSKISASTVTECINGPIRNSFSFIKVHILSEYLLPSTMGKMDNILLLRICCMSRRIMLSWILNYLDCPKIFIIQRKRGRRKGKNNRRARHRSMLLELEDLLLPLIKREACLFQMLILQRNCSVK